MYFSLDLMDSIKHRNSRGTSRLSNSSLSSTGSSKNTNKDIGVQTSVRNLLPDSNILHGFSYFNCEIQSNLQRPHRLWYF